MSLRRSFSSTAIRCLLACSIAVVSACADDEPQTQTQPERELDFEAIHKLRERNQKRIISDFFAGRRDGVFVDVGAAHYKDMSTTYFLERQYGWSGVAIDALEHWGAGYAEHRPRTRFHAYIVTDHAGALEPMYRITGDIGSTAVKERAEDLTENYGKEVVEILVPTTTLDRLLDDEGVTKIDFLSIDIEGAELLALGGFDIRRFRPTLVGVEAFPENQPALLEYFERNGYRRIDAFLKRHGGDWYFTCKEKSFCAAPSAARSPEGS